MAERNDNSEESLSCGGTYPSVSAISANVDKYIFPVCFSERYNICEIRHYSIELFDISDSLSTQIVLSSSKLAVSEPLMLAWKLKYRDKNTLGKCITIF